MQNKRKKIQVLLSLIPFISMFGILIYTYINLKKYKASFKRWLMFIASCIIFTFACYIVNNMLLSGVYPIFYYLTNYFLCVAFSNVLIEIQLGDKQKKDEQPPIEKKKISKKFYWIIIGVVSVAITVIFCFTALPFFLEGIIDARNMKIEDTNGEADYTLNTITREQLINSTESSIMFYGELKEGKQSLITDDAMLEDVDYDTVNFDSGRFNGVTIVQATKTEKDSIKFNINTTLEKGNAELAIIIDNEYYCNVEINKQSEIVLEDISNKTILLKAAGESADIRVEVQRQ